MVAHQDPLHSLIVNDERCPSPEIETRKSLKSIIATSDNNKRGIRFDKLVYVRATLHINNYTDEEFNNAWYHKKDYNEFKKSFTKTIFAFQDGLDVDEGGEEVCFRGLEPRTQKGFRRRRDNKFVGKCSVLDVQDRQHAAGYCDGEIIAKGYAYTTRHCRSEAYAMGLKDQIEALYVYSEAHDGVELTAQNEQRRQRLKSFIKMTVKLRKEVLEESKCLREETTGKTKGVEF